MILIGCRRDEAVCDRWAAQARPCKGGLQPRGWTPYAGLWQPNQCGIADLKGTQQMQQGKQLLKWEEVVQSTNIASSRRLT